MKDTADFEDEWGDKTEKDLENDVSSPKMLVQEHKPHINKGKGRYRSRTVDDETRGLSNLCTWSNPKTQADSLDNYLPRNWFDNNNTNKAYVIRRMNDLGVLFGNTPSVNCYMKYLGVLFEQTPSIRCPMNYLGLAFETHPKSNVLHG